MLVLAEASLPEALCERGARDPAWRSPAGPQRHGIWGASSQRGGRRRPGSQDSWVPTSAVLAPKELPARRAKLCLFSALNPQPHPKAGATWGITSLSAQIWALLLALPGETFP